MLQGIICILLLALMLLVTLVLLPQLLCKIGGGLSQDKIDELMAADALVLDVRNRTEYTHGHGCGLNIPLEELQSRLQELDPTRPVLTCCASGVRSAKAKQILEAAGFTAVHNAGFWMKAKKMKEAK